MRVGVIGAGAISDIYLTNMITRFENLEVVAVAANHLENAWRKAEKYGIQACTVEEMLADPGIEMVVILTPVGSHYDLIRRALLAGKHVYTEKTLTDRLDRAKELACLAGEKGLYLGCAPDTFLGAALQTARTALDEGLLGEVHSFAISVNRNNDVLLSMFGFLREPGAGALLDYGVYYLTALTGLLGPVARVAGVIGTPYRTHVNILPGPEQGKVMDTPNESQVSAILMLRSGVTGTLHMDHDSKLQDEAFFAIYGTRGILYLTDPNQFGGKVVFHPAFPDKDGPVGVTLHSFASYADNSRGLGPSEMAGAIQEGRPCRASKEMAVHVLEVLEAILAGGEKGAFRDIATTFERPLPLEPIPVGIRNIGHAALRMHHEKEMLAFYGELLGMKPLFTLTLQDLADTLREQEDEKGLEKLQGQDLTAPWIRYMKRAERQFVELFFQNGKRLGKTDRRSLYGCQAICLETENAAELCDRLRAAGVEITEELHTEESGNRVFSAADPDGNLLRFTEAGQGALSGVVFAVQDAFNMRNFYTKGLGLHLVRTLTGPEVERTFVEVVPGQVLELQAWTEKRGEKRDLSDVCGYQHLCLEVADIYAAYAAVTHNGIEPDTGISRGSDGAYQFWVRDPDGNRIEFMEYSPEAKQLL
ncbi:MAG: VOC family protein [Clostridia bacterium]|nr:VOC family protein [Clostridia bacterium]